MDNSPLGPTRVDNGPLQGPRSCQQLDKDGERNHSNRKMCAPHGLITFREVRDTQGSCCRPGISWPRSGWKTILSLYPGPSLPSCSFSAANPQPQEQVPGKGCSSTAHREFDHRDLLPGTCQADCKRYRTARFCFISLLHNFYLSPPRPPYCPVSTTVGSC